MTATARKPAVAGAFYPGEKSELHRMVTDFLSKADGQSAVPKAIIAPHAGYIYSGGVAASAYAPLRKVAGDIRQVILLGPAHRVAFKGLAAPAVDFFATPLGNVRLNRRAIRQLLTLPQLIESDEAHAQEHSLEVHLPFLQEILGDFLLVPLVVGDASPAEVSEVLELLWGGPETLIVISSDLSHYHDYETAREMDRKTSDSIVTNQLNITSQDACGSRPIKGLLTTVTKLGLKGNIIDLCNSGDTAGDKNRVVGYGAYHFGAHDMHDIIYSEAHKKALLALARHSIEYGVAHGVPLPSFTFPKQFNIKIPKGSFVTINKNRKLRGCIGTLQAHRPLPLDVMQNAFKAAFQDPRFSPVRKDELGETDLHISILSASNPMHFTSQQDLIRQLKPYEDGLILRDKDHTGTFLPSVWEHYPEPEDFFNHLKNKAGLPMDYWSNTLSIQRYSTLSFGEHDLRH